MLTKHKTNTFGLLFVLYTQAIIIAIIFFDFSAFSSIQKKDYMIWIGVTVAADNVVILGRKKERERKREREKKTEQRRTKK